MKNKEYVSIKKMNEYIDKEKLVLIKKNPALGKKELKLKNKEIKKNNEEIEIAEFMKRELNRYGTSFGTEFIKLCRMIAQSEAGDTQTDFEKIPEQSKDDFDFFHVSPPPASFFLLS